MTRQCESENIVFVLGAGASKPFGFPLGSELIIKIIKGIKGGKYQDIYNRFQYFKKEPKEPIKYNFFQNAYEAFYSAINYSRNKKLVERYDESYNISLRKPEYHITFAEMLNSRTAESIDYVLSENPSYNFIGRLYIVLEMLLAYGYSKTTQSPNYDKYKKLAPGYAENWYISLAEFIKSLGRKTGNLNELCNNGVLRFITFNYDMSLEHYFSQFFGGEIYKDFNEDNIIANISHVYGKVKCFNIAAEEDLENDEFILKVILSEAENISLIRRGSIKENKEESICQWIKNANVIFVLGFAFDEENLEVIGLDEVMENESKRIVVLNFDNNQYISRLAEGRKNVSIINGSIKEVFQHRFISHDICMKRPLVQPHKYR